MTPVKPGTCVAHGLDLAQDRRLGPVLDHPPLVLGDRAEGAAAEAAAHDRHREADHLVGRDLRVAVAGVRLARVGQLVDAIHLRRRQRQRRRVQPDVTVAVPLDQRARVPRVRLDVQDARRVRVQHRIGRDGVEVGHAHDRARAVGARPQAGARHEAGRRRVTPPARRAGGAPPSPCRGLARRGRRVRIDGRRERPGRVDRRRVDLGPAVAAAPAGRVNAVPRRSVMLSGASPAASRCAISTTARSPLP